MDADRLISHEDATRQALAGLIDMIPAAAVAIRKDPWDAIPNRAFRELVGRPDAESTRLLEDAVHPDDLGAAIDFIASTLPDQPSGPVEVRLRHFDGSSIRCTWLARLDTVTDWLIGVAMDITESEERHDALVEQVRRDELTGLANRAGLLEALQTPTTQNAQRIIAVVDLDRFKAVNDTFGHAVGDDVLRIVADRLRSAAPSGTVVSRTGGDEFVLLIPDPSVTAAELGPALTSAIGAPMVLGERQITISCSVGIASSRGLANATDLLQQADLAGYEAKRHHGAAWIQANEALVSERRAEMALEHKMRIALGTGQFTPWFQPIVSLADRQPMCHESLMRWVQPDGVVIPAFEFVELASNVGMVATIGRELVEKTLDVTASLDERQRVSINLSPAELADLSWLQSVVAGVDIRGIDRRRITFEVTETGLIQDLPMASKQLSHLADLGFTISLDDFGSGYSSLTYLTTLPIHEVKLDRALLAGRVNSAAALRTFEAIVRFVHEVGYSMVVEGVETEADHDYLLGLGVEYAQGWLYGKAVPPASIIGPRHLAATATATGAH